MNNSAADRRSPLGLFPGPLAPLPDALAGKHPNADRHWGWQWVFPASSPYLDQRTGIQHRHHLHESVVEKAVHQAAHGAGLAKRVTTHAFRHSCRKPRPASVAGLSGLTGRPKTGRKVIGREEVVRNKAVAAPARHRWFGVTLTGIRFIRVSRNRS